MKATPDSKRKRRGVYGGGNSGRGGTYHGEARRAADAWRAEHSAGGSPPRGGHPGPASLAANHDRLTHAPVVTDPTTDYCTDYARAVVDGSIVAGPTVRAACRRHLADHERATRPGATIWYDHGAAQHFAIFCEVWLRFYAGQFAGRPFVLEPAQEFIAGSIFGWRAHREGYPIDDPTLWPRRFRRAYLEIAKGNGKTPLMAAIALYGLLADRERGAEIYIGASKKKQAHVCFDDAVRMARESPIYQLLRVSGISPAYRVDHLPSESSIDILSSESGKTESGIKPHIVLLDEVHEHPDDRIIDMMQRGFKWRRQPLIVMATNSGWDITSVAWAEHEHARKVATGEVEDDATFGYVADLDPGDEPLTDRRCWVKANPLLGVAATEDQLVQAVADAGSYPTRQNNIRRLHFCQWTAGDTSWVTADDWMAIEHSERGGLDLLAGRPCIMAVDLSHSYDSTAVAYVAETGTDEAGRPTYTAHVRAYLPAAGIREREETDRRPWASWARLHPDMMRLTDGVTVEHEAVAADIIEDMGVLDVRALVYDAYLFDAFSRVLAVMGVGDHVMQIEHPQGWTKRRGNPLSMSISIGTLERFMRAGRLRVHENPVLRAAVAGARQLASPTGQSRWDKAKSTARIDSLVALTMAIGVTDVGLDNLQPSKTADGKRERLAAYWRSYAAQTEGEAVSP